MSKLFDADTFLGHGACILQCMREEASDRESYDYGIIDFAVELGFNSTARLAKAMALSF